MSSITLVEPHITASKVEWRDSLYTFLLALFLVGFLFLLQDNINLDLGGDGFLWDGAIRTAQGDVPLRDFHGYDPGRYYWIAAWFLLSGQQGIIDLRFSVALFQVIGLTCGLLAARRVIKSWWLLSLVGLLLLVWMYPRNKLFESSLTMMAVYIGVRLVENPVPRHYFVAGLFVGLTIFMGRNHGLYNFLAFFILILLIQVKLHRRLSLKQIGLWLGGIAVGLIPLLLMLALLPGFFKSYMNLFIFLLRQGETNLPLPVPWPWNIDYVQQNIIRILTSFFRGVLFLALPLFYLAAFVTILRTRALHLSRHALFVASTVVGMVYMHFAFSRADLAHLAQSIHPFFLAVLALPGFFRWQYQRSIAVSLAVFIFITTLFAMVIPANPYIAKLRAQKQFVSYEISGNQLWLKKRQAAYIETVKRLVSQHVGPEENILIVPQEPGLYPILQRQAPLWNTYFFFPAAPEEELQIIDNLTKQQVNWVLLDDVAMDGYDELRFRYTHPLVWQYLMTEFEPVEAPGLSVTQLFLHRKD